MRRNPFHIVPAPMLNCPAASHSLRGVPDFPSASRRAIALPMFPLAAQRAPQTPSRAAEPGCSKNSGDCPPLQKTLLILHGRAVKRKWTCAPSLFFDKQKSALHPATRPLCEQTPTLPRPKHALLSTFAQRCRGDRRSFASRHAAIAALAVALYDMILQGGNSEWN